MNRILPLLPSLRVLTRSSATANFTQGAVVTNGPRCAEIGACILHQGGSAVDAAIAAMLSEGVVVPSTMGLGGGFIMTIYNKEKGKVETLDAREVAPKNATEDMFRGDSSRAAIGGLAVGVPGELKGYWEAYKKYGGKVPWKNLVEPSVDLCRNGFVMNEYLESVCLTDLDLLKNDDLLRETFIDSSGKVYPVGQCIKNPRLAKTLELIGNSTSADILYNGCLTENFVKDIQADGGIITVEDMNSYKPKWRTPIKFSLPSDLTVHTSPLPGSGLIVANILNILNGFLDHSQPCSISNWHKIVESFKFGFGRRTELGDPEFSDFSSLIKSLTSTSSAEETRKRIHEDQSCQQPSYYGASVLQPGHGTSNICVLAPNGDAVAATSSINRSWGAGFTSKSTGILLNDTMDDFASPDIVNSYNLPPSNANLIKPGKRPLSSMCPTIILNKKGDVEMVVGAAGGPKIITSVVSTIIKHLWFNYGIQEAVSDKRIHHQLFPMLIIFEEPFRNDMDFVNALHKMGHEYKIESDYGFNAVTTISRRNGILDGALDPRRGGEKTFVF